MLLQGLEHLGDLEYMCGGGMASVYRGNVHDYGDVAVKVPRPDCPLARFERELEIMLAVGGHERIVRTYDGRITSAHQSSYMIMEWVPFPTLEDVFDQIRTMGRTPLGWQDAAKVGYHVCVALGHAYGTARVRAHRDIKPNNIFVDLSEGTLGDLKLADFGIAATTERSTLTRRIILGRPEYMAPERMKSGADASIDQRADIYSIGAVMYECLCGEPPYVGADELSILAMALRDDVVPIGRKCPGLPRAAAAATMKCLSRSPASRWDNVGQLASELEKLADVSMRGVSRVPVISTPVKQASPSEAMDVPSTPLAVGGDSTPVRKRNPVRRDAGRPATSGETTGIGAIVSGIVLMVFGFIVAGLGGALISSQVRRGEGMEAILICAIFGTICVLIGLILLVTGLRSRNRIASAGPVQVDASSSRGSIASSVRGAGAELRVLTGNTRDPMIRLYDYPITCGRASNVDLRLPEDDISASRVHANIVFEGGVYVLHDRGRNGIVVNGVHLSGAHQLRSGDQLQMGQTVVQFVDLRGGTF